MRVIESGDVLRALRRHQNFVIGSHRRFAVWPAQEDREVRETIGIDQVQEDVPVQTAQLTLDESISGGRYRGDC